MFLLVFNIILIIYESIIPTYDALEFYKVPMNLSTCNPVKKDRRQPNEQGHLNGNKNNYFVSSFPPPVLQLCICWSPVFRLFGITCGLYYSFLWLSNDVVPSFFPAVAARADLISVDNTLSKSWLRGRDSIPDFVPCEILNMSIMVYLADRILARVQSLQNELSRIVSFLFS